MANAALKEMLSSVGKRMAEELRDKLISHPGELGLAREEIFRQFLRGHLPKRFDIASGFVFDANGIVSKQLDVIIADTSVCPSFVVSGGIRFFPCECVVAAGQLKSNAASRRAVWDAVENLRSVSLLDRSANGRAVCSATGERIDHTSNHLHRIFTFLMIFDHALSGEATRELLLEVVHRSDAHLWPNVTFALGKYIVTFCCENGVCPNTLDARGIALVDAEDLAAGLVRFYVYLSEAVTMTSVARLPSFEYLRDLVPLHNSVIYAATNLEGELPPYLSSLASAPWQYPYDH